MARAFWDGFAKRLRERQTTQRDGNPSDAETPEEVLKEPPMQIDGRCMSAEEFVHYVENLDFAPPLPTRVFVHHTWRPTREDWAGHAMIMAMKAYYERQQWRDAEGRLHEGWTAGPHLFVADDGIWLFSDLRYDGVGVYGQNYRSRHLEMVGNYDEEQPSGATLSNTLAALGILHERLGLEIQRLNFHRDFASNSCPGRAVEKAWLIPLVQEWMAAYRRDRQGEMSALCRALTAMVQELLLKGGLNPDAALAKGAAARGFLGALTQEVPMEIDGKGYIVQFFAETLLVPVNQWDKVQTLGEFERARQDGARGAATDLGEDAAPPTDPYDFQGVVRA